jgi:hypothetical protein
MKPHKWHKEIKKWADGAQIQFKIDDQWIDVPDDESPEWYEENEYRIKPQPTAGQFKKWQGLTDDEILKLKSISDLGNWFTFARAIEQALRYKNS